MDFRVCCFGVEGLKSRLLGLRVENDETPLKTGEDDERAQLRHFLKGPSNSTAYIYIHIYIYFGAQIPSK